MQSTQVHPVAPVLIGHQNILSVLPPVTLQPPVQLPLQTHILYGLDNIVYRLVLIACQRVFCQGSQENDAHFLILGPDALCRLQTVHYIHLNVQKNQIQLDFFAFNQLPAITKQGGADLRTALSGILPDHFLKFCGKSLLIIANSDIVHGYPPVYHITVRLCSA